MPTVHKRASKRASRRAPLTTVNVSRAFAEALGEIAKGEGLTIGAFCDRELLPNMRRRAAESLQKRLDKMQSDTMAT